jgi:type II secretory pathway pseudopilin PulG
MELIKNEEGFTLLEIVISLGIILILVIAFSGGIMNAFRTESRVDQRLEAIRVTDSIIESLRANKEDWKDIDWEDDNQEFWEEINSDIGQYNVGKNNSEITIDRETVETNLFSFNIVWSDRNYSTEVLLAGEE